MQIFKGCVGLMAYLALALSASAEAADRGNAVPSSIESAPTPLSQPQQAREALKTGNLIGKDLYARSEVIYHSANEGTVTVRVDGQLVRLNENTLEIVEILNDF